MNMNKDCPKDKILNPKTNRYVSINGKIGKELLKSKTKTIKKDKKDDCPKDKILNPKTNRCVSINGKIGKELLKSKTTTIKNDNKDDKKRFKLHLSMPLNHSLNQEQVNKYIQASDEETRPILKKIFDNTIHISFEKMMRQLNINIKELVELAKTKKKKDIYFFMNFRIITKSNDWLYIYVKDYFDYFYPEYLIKIIQNLNNNKKDDIIVFVDDCIYSGNQMSENIEVISNPNKLKLTVFILCPYISVMGYNNVKSTFETISDFNKYGGKLIFNKKFDKIPEITSFLTEDEIKKINEYTDYKIDDSHLIYFDHKLADQLSTITGIYSGYVLNTKNSKIFKYNEYASLIGKEKIKLTEADHIPIMNNCENVRNLSLDIPSCPLTPYIDDSFNDFLKEIKKQRNLYKSI